MKHLWYRLRILWRVLTEWLPVTVWQTSGPNGIGPWFEKPEDAANFCTEECAFDNGWDGNPEHTWMTIYFLPDELEALKRKKVRKLMKADWCIERLVIPRRRLVEEWNGW